MTFPSLKSEKSSKRSNSRSRSRSRSNRRRTRKHRNRNKRNNNNNLNNNNGNNSRMNNNNNNNNNFNNKMEIDSDDSNHSLLSSPINELNLTESASISSYTSSTSSLLSLSSTPAPCSSNIVRGKNRKRHRRRNRNKRKLKIVNNNNNNNEDTMKVSKEQCQQIEQQQNENEMKEQREPEKEEELVQEEKVEIIDDIQENAEEEEQEAEEAEQAEEEEEEELREFRFDIKDDSNLRDIINNNINPTNLGDIGLLPTNINSTQTHTGMNTDDDIITNNDELTSEYILSKLYNYMKISEMSKYGISVFEMTFTSYLPYLSESDLTKLATSYWCNGAHFNCMISHRGDIIKSATKSNYTSYSYHFHHERENDKQKEKEDNKDRLELIITTDLLDAAMQSGASVDKIEAMLLQKRIDDGINDKNKKLKKKTTKDGRLLFHQTKYEKSFYLRNLKHRFWNHEVLVRVFIQNGWLTPNLAETAMKTFIKTIYHRVLESKLSQQRYNENHNNRRSRNNRRNSNNNNQNNVKFSENFLHSFFVSYFCLDNIPKMYREEIKRKMDNNNNKYLSSSIISEETLRRWCELIELLASRGANINESQFKKVIPLQYALNLGKNTYKIISSTHSKKNQLFIPDSYQQENITVPNDIWDVMVSYL